MTKHISTGQIAELLAIDSRGGGISAEVQALIARLTNKESTVPLEAAPFCPEGWTVESHVGRGAFAFFEGRIGRAKPTESARHSKTVEHALGTLADPLQALNANVLDALLMPGNQRHIPAEWGGRYTFFPGTIYRDGQGKKLIRCLSGWAVTNKWDWGGFHLADRWSHDFSMAVAVVPF